MSVHNSNVSIYSNTDGKSNKMGALFRPEHQQSLETFVTSTLQNDSQLAMSAWRRIFPTDKDKAIARAEVNILTAKGNAQLKLIEMMGRALIDEFELRTQWKLKVVEAQLKGDASVEMMRIRMETFQKLNQYNESIQKEYGKRLFSFLNDFHDTCSSFDEYPESIAKLAREEYRKNFERQIRSLSKYVAQCAADIEEFS